MSTNTDDQEYSARRIHQSLGGTTAFFQGYTIGEIMLFVGVAFVTLIGAALVPATFTIPVLGFGLMLGLVLGVLHKVKPSYLWLTEWLAARLGWAVKNKEYTHGEDNSEVRYLTRVGQVFPHAIERSDGALVGAMKVEPANMALEDDDAWAKAVDSLSEFVNATIDFPVKFYITSREVDQDDVVRDHQRRLGDADVRSRPVLKRLLDEYITTNTDQNGDIDSEATTIREYYIITAVRDADVEQLNETGDSVLAYLADIPCPGSCVWAVPIRRPLGRRTRPPQRRQAGITAGTAPPRWVVALSLLDEPSRRLRPHPRDEGILDGTHRRVRRDH